jgi:hypothetical protein
MPVFERFAALVILAVAAHTAGARVGEILPRPAIIVAAGLVASVNLGSLEVAFTTDLALVGRAVAAASVGVGFALLIALLGPWLRAVVDIDRFRFGSAVALGVLPLSIFGFVEAPIALAVLGVTVLFAFDPDGSLLGDSTDADPAVTDGGPSAEAVDASDDADDADDEDDEDDENVSDRVSNYITTESERAPWL